jgi:hypothetical protein
MSAFSPLIDRLRGIKITPARGVVAAAVLFAAWRVYEAPDDDYYTDRNIAAVENGALFAGYILDGRKSRLEEHAIGPASERLEKEGLPNFDDVIFWREIAEAKAPNPRSSRWDGVTIVFSRDDSREPAPVRLQAFNSRDSYYVMTYLGMSSDYRLLSSPVMKDGMPMMAAVVLRHVTENESRLKILGRKVANGLWLPKAWGERGRWVLVAFDTSFNRREYFDWLKANGPRLEAEDEANRARVMSNIGAVLQDAQNNASKSLEEGEVWANDKWLEQMHSIAGDFATQKED